MPEVTGRSRKRAWLDGEANDDRGKIRVLVQFRLSDSIFYG